MTTAVEDRLLRKTLSNTDRFLPLWILLAVSLGVALSAFAPGVSSFLHDFSVGTVSVPIAACLLIMMYPVLAKVRYGQASLVRHDTRLVIPALTLNWIVAPALMFSLAWLFFPDNAEIRTGLIIVGIAPCIAMVMIWIDLAGGDREAGAFMVAINAVIQVFAFGVLGWFYLQLLPSWLGLSTTSSDFSFWAITASVVFFLGVPLISGFLTRVFFERSRGRDWYEAVFLPRISPLALWGLLATIALLFALQGQQVRDQPFQVVLIALPLLIYFFVMFVTGFFTGRALGLSYMRTVTMAFTASGNNFELAIAVAIATYGATSGEALAGIVGPMVEVPVLIAMVYLARWLKSRVFPPETGA
jgi:ACR3 family arsenite transporter